MTEEQAVKTDLEGRFPGLQGKVRIARARRVFAEVPDDQIDAVLDHVVARMGFTILCTITGLDLGETFGVIYHVARESGVVLNLEIRVPKAQPVVHSITGRFPAADLYEREMVDLLGIQVQGLPEGKRYPLPDDWPAGQYPLRKDWKPASSAQDKTPGEVKNE
jgi:Ni,Fe-hydrogenase III component G